MDGAQTLQIGGLARDAMHSAFTAVLFISLRLFYKASLVATSTVRSRHPMFAEHFALLAAVPQVLLVMAECTLTFELEILYYHYL